MLPKQPIKDLLDELKTLYDSTSDSNHKVYYSKLALIELCGWIELCIDEILETYIDLKLNLPVNIALAKTNYIKQTYGFEYDRNLRPLLIKIIGLINVENIEEILEFDSGTFTLLKAQLNNLVSLRNQAAHTTIVGVTHTYQAPNAILTNLNNIHVHLTKLELTIMMV
jgi:hypothetical protein